MSWFGTDVVALSCILGSAAVGGAATLALMADADHQDHRCAVETVAVTPSVAVSHGSGVRAIVVKPNVRVRSSSDCARQARHVVTIHRGHELGHLEANLEHMEANLEHVEQAIEIQMERLEAQIEAQVEASIEQEFEAQVQFEEAMKALEEAKVKVVVAGSGTGGS